MNIKYFTTFCLYFMVHCVFSQCPPGDVFLFTQEEVDNMVSAYPNCEIINRDLIIADDVSDISKLDKIKRIEGSLVIMNTKITNIANFTDLDFVLGDFYIEHNENMPSIEGINKLTSVGGDLVIATRNGGLKSISGFNSLQRIGGNFTVSQNQDLTSFTGFSVLESAEGWFTISINRLLPSIPNFNQLKLIGNDLTIENNAALTQVNGFNLLEEITRSFTIKNNAIINSVTGFNQLNRVIYQMEINGERLSVIPNFINLNTIGGSLSINNTALTSITGFNNITVIGDINPALGFLIISENDILFDVTGFNNVTQLEGNFEVKSNSVLQSLIGFGKLSKTKTLKISSNNSLSHLIGLETLKTVGEIGGEGIVISENSSLSDCSVICNLLENGTVFGVNTISNNPSNCSSEAEITENCRPDFDNDGILNSDDLDDDNDGILDTVEQNGDVTRDSDGDNYPDHRDLDSDNDGCFDVVEAGFTDEDTNGILGNAPDLVDTNGLITGETSGYTMPLDADTNGTFDFQENNLKRAGEDGNLKICTYDDPYDLFDSLLGTPDIGGIWSPSLTSGSGIFDPSVDLAGTYTYTVSNGICGNNTSVIEVDISTSDGDLRTYSELDICIKSAPVDLFQSLEDNPNPDGEWHPKLASNSGIFDPSIDNQGMYTYTASSNELCANKTSRILVNIIGLESITDYGINASGFSDSKTIEVNVNSELLYEYSLDGINFQDSNTFKGLQTGVYNLYVQEIGGCGFLQESISISGFPRFFSPNGDGINDYWAIGDTSGETYSISIYNRYGKFIKFLKTGEVGWDGTYNGDDLPVDDYWYKAVSSNGKVRLGHFSLKR